MRQRASAMSLMSDVDATGSSYKNAELLDSIKRCTANHL